MIDRGEPVDIIDLRSPLKRTAVPYTIPGARWMNPEGFERSTAPVARDHDVVLFCACPNEATSARAALALERIGYARIRPLAGGLAAWQSRRFPLVPADGHRGQAAVSR